MNTYELQEQANQEEWEAVCNLPTDTPERLQTKLDAKEELIFRMLHSIADNLNIDLDAPTEA